MSYSIISLLALILNLILNRETLVNIRRTSGGLKTEQKFITRYRQFLIVSSLYLIVDIGWGILYDHHEITALFILIVFYTFCSCS